MKPAASWIVSPAYLGSLYQAALSACLNASAQNIVQNQCAWAHRGSMPTQSMISQNSGCRRCSMALIVALSLALSPWTAIDRLLRSGTANTMRYYSPRGSSHPTYCSAGAAFCAPLEQIVGLLSQFNFHSRFGTSHTGNCTVKFFL